MILPFLSTHFCLLFGKLVYDIMRLGVGLIAIGAIMIPFGVVFYLQGNSLVGPIYSFMYSNPKWIVNGLVIAACGVAVLAAGLGISLRRPKS
jgi:hypothetical protein